MKINESSWNQHLIAEFKKDYFIKLQNFVNAQYESHECFPRQELIFNAFNRTALENIKVVIIGQDPYHGPGQANGLCFSVADGIAKPPSLINIFKELEQDLLVPTPLSGNLERWADQGVLLLNAVLTVRKGEAGSHQKQGWEQFTDAVIKLVSEHRHDVVFMLWGGFAKGKSKLIDVNKHIVLTSGHPSPLSANRGHWFSNAHFSQANKYLLAMDKQPIRW